MVAFNGKLQVVKRAIRIDAAPLSRELLCSLVKKTFDLKHKPAEAEIEAIRAQEYKRGLAEGERRAARGTSASALMELNERVKEFEQASGIKLTGTWEWQAEEIGRAVRIVIDILRGERSFLDDRDYFLQRASSSIKDYKDGLDFLRSWKARTEQAPAKNDRCSLDGMVRTNG
jgi:hypothetical protein